MPRALRALALLPLLALLVGWRFDAGIDIRDESDVAISFTVAVPRAEADAVADLCVDQDEAKVERIDEPDQVGCVISNAGRAEDMGSEMIVLADGVWKVEMAVGEIPLPPNDKLGEDLNFSLIVKFPGEVLSHSGDSTVEGTTVVWSGLEDAPEETVLTATGVDIAGPKPAPSPTDAASPAASPPAKAAISEDDSSGPPAYAVALIIVGAAGAIGLVGYGVWRRAQRSKADESGAPTDS